MHPSAFPQEIGKSRIFSSFARVCDYKESVLMQRLSYPTENFLSKKITRNGMVLSYHSETVLENIRTATYDRLVEDAS